MFIVLFIMILYGLRILQLYLGRHNIFIRSLRATPNIYLLGIGKNKITF